MTKDILPNLFRDEYRKLVSVLCRRFGFAQIEIAEDLASETFLVAAQTWGIKGIPPNPSAWLHQVAKNKAKNHLQRQSVFDDKLVPEIKRTSSGEADEIDLSPQNINDSQLQMMFAICHPSLSAEAQIGLSLRILCGFGVEEIADAFLTSKETINKRLFRAREKLRSEKISIQPLSSLEVGMRLPAVLATIYLLFSEGYYSESQPTTIRKDFCVEAMRLCHMLVENESANEPQANALLALMCFHASRLNSRVGQKGETVLYDDQDISLWNTDLITRGGYYLSRAATGERLSKYHLEATIAYWHTQKTDSKEKWESILQLYNKLLQIEYSPMAALNRTYALSRANGKLQAIGEAEKLCLTRNHYYFTLLGDLYTGVDDKKAIEHFQTALTLAKTSTDQQTIQRQIDGLGS